MHALYTQMMLRPRKAIQSEVVHCSGISIYLGVEHGADLSLVEDDLFQAINNRVDIFGLNI